MNSARIVKTLVNVLIAEGYRLTVFNGTATVIEKSRAKDDVLKAIGSAEEDVLYIYRPCGKLEGSLFLCHSGVDVLDDHTDSLAEVLEPIHLLVNTMKEACTA